MTSEVLTLPVPLLHVHMVASPPSETLFSGQEIQIGCPGTLVGSMYSFCLQATYIDEKEELDFDVLLSAHNLLFAQDFLIVYICSCEWAWFGTWYHHWITNND